MVELKKIVFVACMLCVWQGQAAEINFSGFATLAAGITFDEDESLKGYDEKFNFSSGSLIALQASSDLGDGWGVTTQVLARGSEEWDPTIEWAYVSYDATSNLRLLFGRQRTPFYIYSDYLDVSYAYHWITPPAGVYSLALDTFDGVSAIYSNSLGEFDSTVHVSYGRSAGSANILGGERETDFNNFYTASLTVTRDWLTLRTNYVSSGLNIETDNFSSLIDGWRATGAYAGVADDLQIVEDRSSFIGVGFIVDYDDYLIVGEFTNLDAGDNLIPEQDSYYLTVGKRFDSVLLHVTYGGDENTSDFSILNGIPTGNDDGIDTLLGNTNGLLKVLQEDSKYVVLGLRWDVGDSIAAKVEYTDYQDDDILGTDASLLEFALTAIF